MKNKIIISIFLTIIILFAFFVGVLIFDVIGSYVLDENLEKVRETCPLQCKEDVGETTQNPDLTEALNLACEIGCLNYENQLRGLFE